MGKSKLPCPVCGEKHGQLEQHIRRKQDQAHRKWREDAAEGGADQQGQKPEEPETQETQEVQEPEGSGGSDDMFESHADAGGGQKQVQQQKPPQQGAQRQQMGMQKKIELAKQGKEPWEHDCKNMEGKAEFYEKKDQCPRCGANLQWGQLGV
jgi:transcription elongation factor Elf1